VAAGNLDFGSHRTFSIMRIDPAHGQLLSFSVADFQHEGVANALAMLGNDAIAAGEVASDADASEFVVARFGTSPIPTWSTRLNGNASCGADVANAVAIDVELGVFAAGQVTNSGIETDSTVFTVVKLSPIDGSVLWRRELGDGVARALVLDGGSLYVTGTFDGTFSVVKLTAGNGDVLWTKDVGAGEGLAIVRGNAGTVVAAGQLGGQFGVVTLDGTNGGSVWSSGQGLLGRGVARDLTRLTSGDVIAAGETDDAGELRFTTARFTAATGAVVWKDSDPDVPAPASAYGVAAAGNDVVSVGTAAHDGGPTSFSVRALDAVAGGLRWGTGIPSGLQETRALTVRFDGAGNVVVAGALDTFFDSAAFTVQKLDAEGNDYEDPCGNDELEQVTFLDLNADVVSSELEREQQARRSGPTAEAILRRIGTVSSKIG